MSTFGSRFAQLAAGSGQRFQDVRSLIPGGAPGGLGSQNFPHPVFATQAKGCYLWDADGRQLLDMINGDWLLPAGHCHPHVIAAITEQLQRGTTFAIPEATLGRDMALRLQERMPSLQRMRFTNSGTEATMFAMRLARAFTGKGKIAKVLGGYHGTNDIAMIGNGHIQESQRVPPGLIPRCEESVVLIPYNDCEGAEKAIMNNAGDLAGVIVEPILGAAGMIPARQDYLEMLRSVTQACQILLIFDETVTFTLSYGGAQGWFGIEPDLTTLGKAIGGGLPLGVFGGRADVMGLVDPYVSGGGGVVRHGSTTGGIPVCLAAGIAALDLLTEDTYAQLHTLGDAVRHGITDVASHMGAPLQVTGAGHFFGMHWTDRDVEDFGIEDRGRIKELVTSLYNDGFLLFANGCGVVSMPMVRDDISEFLAALPAALASLAD
jgi:glutamate-1-semialdehyde 2,1-aminomutase